MDDALSSNSNPECVTEAFTLVALVSTDLTAGEMVHFDVDAAGNITSPNFAFVATTPRVAKITAVQAVTPTPVTSTGQSESTAALDVSPTGLNAHSVDTIATKNKKTGQVRKGASNQKQGGQLAEKSSASRAEGKRAVRKARSETGSVQPADSWEVPRELR